MKRALEKWHIFFMKGETKGGSFWWIFQVCTLLTNDIKRDLYLWKEKKEVHVFHEGKGKAGVCAESCGCTPFDFWHGNSPTKETLPFQKERFESCRYTPLTVILKRDVYLWKEPYKRDIYLSWGKRKEGSFSRLSFFLMNNIRLFCRILLIDTDSFFFGCQLSTAYTWQIQKKLPFFIFPYGKYMSLL